MKNGNGFYNHDIEYGRASQVEIIEAMDDGYDGLRDDGLLDLLDRVHIEGQMLMATPAIGADTLDTYSLCDEEIAREGLRILDPAQEGDPASEFAEWEDSLNYEQGLGVNLQPLWA